MTYTLQTFKVRLTVSEPVPQKWVNTPKDSLPLLRTIFADLDADQEHFCLLTLNIQNKVTGYKVISSGGMSGTEIDFRLLFRAALALGGTSILIAHNHPSGNPTPSQEDIAITQRIKSAADLLGFTLLDHIVLGDGIRYASLRSDGNL
jgi:DNA repair protein RadC